MERAFLNGLSSVLSGGRDTIVARATAAGAGALAVIRVSGPATERLALGLSPDINTTKPWRATRARLQNETGDFLEEGIAIFYRAPKTFTGEDMLELMVHGSPWVVNAVVTSIISLGARHAEPGEFTRRAVANGKLDLIQAEAINDVINAETGWQARLAREQLHGVLSKNITALREAMTLLLAKVEGSLDFEEQGAVLGDGGLTPAHKSCEEHIEALLGTISAGVRIREGARVVIMGAPNSGKSTLFNALLAQEKAIVTAQPGTTRDVLEADLEIEGLPVVLVDTAGLRKAEDPAEQEGVKRALEEEERSELVITLYAADGDGVASPGPDSADERYLKVISKADLADDRKTGTLAVSCVTGEGLDQLREEIHRRVAAPVDALPQAVAINVRHSEALLAARRHIVAVPNLPLELAALEIRAALKSLDELIGAVDDDAVLDQVFSAFCVGK